MKKQFLAIVGALALALAAPSVALAANSPANIAPTTGTASSGMSLVVSGGKTSGNGALYVAESASAASNTVLETDDIAVVSFRVWAEGDVDTSNLTLTFSVGKQYAGASVKVYIQHDDGSNEVKDAKVASDGTITITVDRLSVFTVVIDKTTIKAGAADGTGTGTEGTTVDTSSKSPQTGVSGHAVEIATGVALVAAAGCAVYAVRSRAHAE